MPASPCHELRHVVADNLGDQLVRAEMRTLDQQREIVLGVVGARVVLPNFDPIATRNIVEAQRRARGRKLCDLRFGPLALGRFYFLGFAPGRALRRAVKAITSEPEIEVPERRAPLAVEGHGESLRVWLAMN
jgi:hypothetical protein